MKLIWPGIFLGTGAVGTAGGLYGNSLYLKSVSRQEANVKFEEIRSEIEAFVKGAPKDERENVSTILVGLWMSWLEPRDSNFEELKRQAEEQLGNSLNTNKEKKLEDLYEKIEDFIKFLENSGINVSEYQSKVVGIPASLEDLLKDD